MNAIQEVKKFQRDRLLHKQEFNYDNEAVNILEELFESYGYDVPKEERQFLMLEWHSFMNRQIEAGTIIKRENHHTHDIIDAYADIMVFSIGAIMKLGYNPECVLEQVSAEINSRSGEIVNGKFQKDLSDEAKAKRYKADFNKCREENKQS